MHHSSQRDKFFVVSQLLALRQGVVFWYYGNKVMCMDFLFELLCEFLATILEPVYNVVLNKHSKIPNKTLYKIAKGTIVVVGLAILIIIYLCLSRLIRGYWI